MTAHPKELSIWKRLLGIVFLTAVMLVSAVGGYLLVQGGGSANEQEQAQEQELELEQTPALLSSLAWLVLGFLFFGGGIFTYVIALVTNHFTLDFSQPFWASQRKKLWFSNVALMVFAGVGLGFVARALLGPILSGLALPAPLPDVIPLVGALLLVQVALMFLNPWASVERSSVRRRLEGYGIKKHDLDGGWLVGISDPNKSSLKKMTAIEEDLGMLWFRGDHLIYRGDTESFEVQRDDLLDIERVADAGSVQAYVGAVHVILRFRTEQRAERRVRLHAISYWHIGAVKRALDALAVRLSAWRRSPPAAATTATPVTAPPVG